MAMRETETFWDAQWKVGRASGGDVMHLHRMSSTRILFKGNCRMDDEY